MPSPRAEVEAALEQCDRAALRAKRQYQRAWGLSTLVTWLTLLLAIAALAFPARPGLTRLVLDAGPGASVVVAAATLYLLLWAPRDRWRNYRRGAESLRAEWMRYLAGLPPYHAGGADLLGERVGLTRRQAEASGFLFLSGRPVEKRSPAAQLLDWLQVPELLARVRGWLHLMRRPGPLAAAAEPGRPGPPPEDRPASAAELEGAALGRLGEQLAWHRRKARKYLGWYIGFQGFIIAVNLLYFGYSLAHGRHVGLAVLTTATCLGVYAFRDFLGFGPLAHRYQWVVGCLQGLLGQYRAARAEAGGVPTAEGVRQLVGETEQILTDESQFWYATMI